MRSISLIQRLFSPLRRHPKDYFWNMFSWLFVTAYMIFSIEITREILNVVTKKLDERLNSLLVIFLLVTLFFIFIRFLLYKEGWWRIMHNGVDIYIKKYLEDFISADPNSVERIGTGRFLTIIDKWLHDWFDLLFEFTHKWMATLAFIVYTVYITFSVSVIAGIGVIIIFCISTIVATWANIWMAKKRIYRRDAYKEATHNTAIVLMSKNEMLQNHSLFLSFLEKISASIQSARRHHETVQLWFLIIEEFPRFMLLLIRIALYIYIARSIWYGSGSFTDFAIFITVITVAEKSLNEFLHLTRDGLRLFSYIELLWNTFDTLDTIRWYESGKSFKKYQKDIVLQNVTFAYGKEKILDALNLKLSYGKKTALVGASGGGKTTLMKLIAWYLHPQEGYVSVLGNRLDETSLKTYYPHIWYLTQDPSVFDGTIRENLVSSLPGWAHLHQSDSSQLEKSLKEALHHAHCDFVFDLDKGIDTEIWERGVRLSGWQKQRLAIAKIFLKNPEIILLDEPTSALDSFSEELVTEALDKLFQKRTVIIIAHRLQTVKKADDIIVIEWWTIEERWTHEELIAKWGIYYKMLELQSGF